jgi:hypothetical protein
MHATTNPQQNFAVDPTLPKSGGPQAVLESIFTAYAPSNPKEALVTHKNWPNPREQRLASFFAENLDKAIQKKLRRSKPTRSIVCATTTLRVPIDIFEDVRFAWNFEHKKVSSNNNNSLESSV